MRIRFSSIWFTSVLVALPFLVTTAQASLVTLADFQFTGSSNASTDPSTIWSTSAIIGGTGALGQIAGQGNPAPGIEDRYSDFNPQNSGAKTLADSLADDHYYGFTVTPGPEIESITYDTMTLDSRRSGGVGFTYSILASTDGTFTAANLVDSSPPGPQGNFGNLTFDLTSLTTISDPVEFRIYLNAPNYTFGGNTLRTDNITLTGTVFVPEPSSALISAALLGLFSLRRRLRAVQADRV